MDEDKEFMEVIDRAMRKIGDSMDGKKHRRIPYCTDRGEIKYKRSTEYEYKRIRIGVDLDKAEMDDVMAACEEQGMKPSVLMKMLIKKFLSEEKKKWNWLTSK